MTGGPETSGSGPFEDELAAVLRERATVAPMSLERIRAGVRTLPPRRRRLPAALAPAAGIVVALGIGAFVLARLPGGPGNASTSPQLPAGAILQDPSVFAEDPRRAMCPLERASYAFTLAHVADFRAFYDGTGFPADAAPALVVVSADRTSSGRQPVASSSPFLAPGHYAVCIVAGDPGSPADWVPIAVTDADLSSLLPAFDMVGDIVHYANDERFARCGGGLQSDVIGAFEMAHARDYHDHLPAMLASPELDVDDPAFVVIFRGEQPFGVRGGRGDGTPVAPPPGTRDVCMLVGATAASGTITVYSGVDMTGATAALPDRPRTPPPTPSASPLTTSTPGPATPEPAPAWTDDLAGQLDCEGPVRTIGGETGDVTEELVGPTPADLAEYLTRTDFDALPGRLELAEHEAHWVRYVHLHDDRLKTVVIATDTSLRLLGQWAIVGLRSCDPAEYDPAVGLAGVYHGIWRDAAGDPAPTELIHEITGASHCGWDSATLMRYEGIQFIRDPEGVLADMQVAPYLVDTDLPETAVDTGLRDGERHLWRSSDGRYVYLVMGDQVEGWPRAVREFGCT